MAITITWSSEPVPSRFIRPHNNPYYANISSIKLKDKEYGPINREDVSKGFRYYLWKVVAEYETGYVYLYKDGEYENKELVFTQTHITYIGLSWDQLGRPLIVYQYQDNIYLWWYDPTIPGITITDLGVGEKPYLRLDDMRDMTIGGYSKNTIIYKVGTTMKYRSQLDRWSTEYDTPVDELESELNPMAYGMSHINRLQLQYEGETVGGELPIYDPPKDDVFVHLGEVAQDISIPATFYKGITETYEICLYEFTAPLDNVVTTEITITSFDDAGDTFDIWVSLIGSSERDCQALAQVSGAAADFSGCMPTGQVYLFIQPKQKVSGFAVTLE